MAYVPFTEDKAVSRPYRVGYLDSVKHYLASLQNEAAEKRASFMTPQRLAQNPECYRRAYYEMLGAPLTEYAALKNEPVTCVEDTVVADTALCEIRRMRLAVLGDYTVYGILFLPHERAENAPFVISQHGGAGTPEVCSDFFGDNNYNHQTMRLLERGAVVFAPVGDLVDISLPEQLGHQLIVVKPHFLFFRRKSAENGGNVQIISEFFVEPVFIPSVHTA